MMNEVLSKSFEANTVNIEITEFGVFRSLERIGFLRCNFFWYLKGSSARDEQKSPAEVKKINLKKFAEQKILYSD